MTGASAGVFAVRIDAEHGGRWTSLTDPGGREWLWSRPDPARDVVRPGDGFVDVGGLEECYPTIGGTPDHGAAWSRPWTARGDGTLSVDTGCGRLSRAVEVGDRVVARYRLDAESGTRFLWAAHALLVPSVGLRVLARPGSATRMWPRHVHAGDGPWPTPLGEPVDVLGPDDGTATFLALLDTADVAVTDRDAGLRWRLSAPDQPVSVGVWRNLGGWPARAPYRNFGVEPMIGRHFDLAQAAPGDTGIVPAGGVVRWTMTVSAWPGS